MKNMYQIIGPFKQVATMAGLSMRGPIKDEHLEIVQNGGILTKNGRIVQVDNFEKLYVENKDKQLIVSRVEGDQIAIPGVVDAHTHICFGGSRAQDYAMRNAGKSYLEIAKAGGGIWDSVTHTRIETEASLTQGILKRVNRHMNDGVTTIEVKSGYGLSVKEELKMLRAIKMANKDTEADLIPTCLAAHIFPKDYKGTISDYLEEMSTELFPILQKEKLTNRIDAFIEEEAYSADRIDSYLRKAKVMGFDITLHVDQFHTGGSAVAVAHKAISADHLEASTDIEIDMIAKSSVIAVGLPGASIGLGCDFAPARKLLDAGAAFAIASDWNPGSAPMGDIWTSAAILGTFQKLSNAEIMAGITFRAAAALNLSDRGRLIANQVADIIAFPTHDHREVLYHQGQMKPCAVWKNGNLI